MPVIVSADSVQNIRYNKVHKYLLIYTVFMQYFHKQNKQEHKLEFRHTAYYITRVQSVCFATLINQLQ